MFTNFLVESAKAVTTIGARQQQLTDLIENANTTFQAIGSQQTQFAQGLHQLPVTLRQGNHTFAELPSTLRGARSAGRRLEADDQAADLTVRALQPLLKTATPAVTDFNQAFSRPGPTTTSPTSRARCRRSRKR